MNASSQTTNKIVKSPTPNDQVEMSAAQQVFNSVELLNNILCNLPSEHEDRVASRRLVLTGQTVSRAWHGLVQGESPALCRKIGLEARTPRSIPSSDPDKIQAYRKAELPTPHDVYDNCYRAEDRGRLRTITIHFDKDPRDGYFLSLVMSELNVTTTNRTIRMLQERPFSTNIREHTFEALKAIPSTSSSWRSILPLGEGLPICKVKAWPTSDCPKENTIDLEDLTSTYGVTMGQIYDVAAAFHEKNPEATKIEFVLQFHGEQPIRDWFLRYGRHDLDNWSEYARGFQDGDW